jgi:hypothetical protein
MVFDHQNFYTLAHAINLSGRRIRRAGGFFGAPRGRAQPVSLFSAPQSQKLW